MGRTIFGEDLPCPHILRLHSHCHTSGLRVRLVLAEVCKKSTRLEQLLVHAVRRPCLPNI